MFLWKNIVVLSALLSFAWALARPLAANRLDTMQLTWLSIVGLGNLALLFTTIPYMLLLSAVAASFFVLWQFRVPPLLSYLFIVTILPLMSYSFGEVGAINTLLILDITIVAGAAVLVLKLARPGMFRSLSFAWPDVAVLIFILLYALLSTRLMPITTIFRQCVENLIVYGGAYFAASRFPLRRPRTLLFGMLFIALFLAFISLFEAVIHWPLFTDTRGMFKAPGFDIRFGLLRSVGPSSDPLAFSLMQAYFGASVVGLWILSKRRDLILLIVAVLAIGILVTGARTGLLGTGAALAMLAFMRKQTVLALGLIGMVVLGLTQLAEPGSDQHLAETADYRVRLLYEVPARMAGDVWIGDPEAVEVGRQLEDLRQGQGIVDLVNSYLELFVNGGLLLLSAFLLLIATAFASYLKFRKLREVSRESRIMMTVALLQLVAMLSGLLVTSLTDKNLFFVMVSIGLISGLQRSREGRKGRGVVVALSAGPDRKDRRWPSGPQPGAA